MSNDNVESAICDVRALGRRRSKHLDISIHMRSSVDMSLQGLLRNQWIDDLRRCRRDRLAICSLLRLPCGLGRHSGKDFWD